MDIERETAKSRRSDLLSGLKAAEHLGITPELLFSYTSRRFWTRMRPGRAGATARSPLAGRVDTPETDKARPRRRPSTRARRRIETAPTRLCWNRALEIVHKKARVL